MEKNKTHRGTSQTPYDKDTDAVRMGLFKEFLSKPGWQRERQINLYRMVQTDKGADVDLVEDRLHEAKLGFLPRRDKSKVSSEFLEERVDYSKSVKRKAPNTLLRYCYTDGTCWYLDKSEADFEQTQHAALGSRVWRRWDGKDALWEECIGPSKYNKAQGHPVRIWGMLACGRLHVQVLEEGEAMCEDLYVELIEDHFEEWSGGCDLLVCDFERALRTKYSVETLTKHGFTLVEGYPRSSQDFNAIATRPAKSNVKI